MWEVPSNKVLPRGECRITLVSNIMLPWWIMQSVHYTSHSFVNCWFCSIQRRTGFSTGALGVEKLSKEDVQKMQWEALKGKIVSWNQYMRVAVSCFFPASKQYLEVVCVEHVWLGLWITTALSLFFLQCFKWYPSDHGRQMQSIFFVSIIIGY